VLNVNGQTVITVADNTDTLKLISTDADANVGPNLTLFRNSSSPANDDNLGRIDYSGESDASSETNFVTLNAFASAVAHGSETGTFVIKTRQAGTEKDRMQMDSAETVFNEDSFDYDFRVESNGNANMIFVDGGNNHVNIGTSTDHGGVLNVDGPILMSESDTLLLRITSSS
jgi:hypothetical protein